MDGPQNLWHLLQEDGENSAVTAAICPPATAIAAFPVALCRFKMASGAKQQWRAGRIIGMAGAKVDALEPHSAQRHHVVMHSSATGFQHGMPVPQSAPPATPPGQSRAPQAPGETRRRQGWPSAMPPGHALRAGPPHPCCGTWRECLALVEKGALEGLQVPLAGDVLHSGQAGPQHRGLTSPRTTKLCCQGRGLLLLPSDQRSLLLSRLEEQLTFEELAQKWHQTWVAMGTSPWPCSLLLLCRGRASP